MVQRVILHVLCLHLLLFLSLIEFPLLCRLLSDIWRERLPLPKSCQPMAIVAGKWFAVCTKEYSFLKFLWSFWKGHTSHNTGLYAIRKMPDVLVLCHIMDIGIRKDIIVILCQQWYHDYFIFNDSDKRKRSHTCYGYRWSPSTIEVFVFNLNIMYVHNGG